MTSQVVASLRSEPQRAESTWASHDRVENIARKELGMRLPAAAEMQVVVP